MPHRVNLHCLTCPEPPDYDEEIDGPLPKYRIKCGEPTITIVCESVEKTAELCGFPENAGYISTPPKSYLRKVTNSTTSTQSQEWICRTSCSPARIKERFFTVISNYNKQEDWDVDGCSLSTTSETDAVIRRDVYDSGFPDCGSTVTTDFLTSDTHLSTLPIISGTEQSIDTTHVDKFNQFSPCEGQDRLITGEQTTITLSIPDDEDNALDRATETEGTDCTSIYELRTTSFSFTHRTVKYTATASGLVKGVSYHGCIRLQKREAYSGTEPVDADTETWIDVEPDEIIAFVASEDEKEVATEVELPIAQGWEYRIEGAYIYPVSSPCECPSNYEEPAE